MSDRGIHLKEISDLLRSWDGDRQILIGAAQEYWAASLDASEWSEPFDAWHRRICRLILGRGGIRATIEAMNDETAGLIAGELTLFSEQARRELPEHFMLRSRASRYAAAVESPGRQPLVAQDSGSAVS